MENTPKPEINKIIRIMFYSPFWCKDSSSSLRYLELSVQKKHTALNIAINDKRAQHPNEKKNSDTITPKTHGSLSILPNCNTDYLSLNLDYTLNDFLP